ncbi:hypothetical protein FisN_6Lh227 [Fistulifera solaris]|uniref:Sister chromatid cohesion protein DCC1 n=1 Tax=Fistulifera solaris TaxID=1519565 RepID=A0A1Z5J5Z0_FISSO|nr:hypothetical protein FisN_6Lh227 [Fistulifera solaris]|eukprot:GAX09400.1 hypothetical protein FisN_6Lh227 [Fistulifera solaris]
MDLSKLSNDGKPNLLTLPRGDLQGNTTVSSFRMMQLPVGWKAEDLANSRFISKPQQQVALVSEVKEMSFWVSNVQSSNCFVLIPPPLDEPDEFAAKKAKLSSSLSSSDQSLRTIPTRLLKPGGSGATFLELRVKVLKVADLQSALVNAHAILDREEENTPPMTIDALARELQHSRMEIRRGLSAMERAFVTTETECVWLLSEEIQMIVQQAIVSTLAEAEDCQDYAGRGVHVERCVKAIVERMSPEERFDQDRDVVHYCLRRLADRTSDTEVIQLDVSKVAKWVARHLFSLQSAPWEESLFMARWQSQTPGVGDTYRVSLEMLRGLAVHRGALWKYLPADQIMTTDSVEDAFELLFDWKDSWELDELQPYLDAMVDATAISQGDLVLQYLKVTTETSNGCSVKMCRKR